MQVSVEKLGYILIILSLVLFSVMTLIKLDFDAQAIFLCEQVSASGGTMASCPAHTSNTPWLLVGGYGIAFLLLAGGIFLVRNSRVTPKPTFTKIDTSKFNDEEKLVYDFIRRNEGSVYQNQIVKESEFSKVKVTRILDNLETKGVLERKRRGMTNIVVLK